jgi:hypothetical protein
MTPNLFLIPFLCASAAAYHVARMTPMLTERGARAGPHVIAGGLAFSAIVAFALVPVIGGGFWQLAGILLWVINNLAPDVLVGITGGPWTPAVGKAEVAAILDDAQARLHAGDPGRLARGRRPSPDSRRSGRGRRRPIHGGLRPRAWPWRPAVSRDRAPISRRGTAISLWSKPPTPFMVVLTPLLAAVVGLMPALSADSIRSALVGLTDGLGAGILDPVCDRAQRS